MMPSLIMLNGKSREFIMKKCNTEQPLKILTELNDNKKLQESLLRQYSARTLKKPLNLTLKSSNEGQKTKSRQCLNSQKDNIKMNATNIPDPSLTWEKKI